MDEKRELKDRAKAVLKKIYWKAFLVSIVIALAEGDGGGSGGGGSSSNSSSNIFPSDVLNGSELSNIVIFIIAVIGVILVFLALRILLGYPLEVGGRKYFIQSAQYKENKKCFRFTFNRKNYQGIILTMLLKGVQNTLWYLLLIPGIVKYYSYRMVPYILADNPNIGCKRAIELSNKMTEGHKLDMFILDLSFLGWFLLGLLALLIGVLFVLPYVNATYAELYLVLRRNVIENNWCSNEELLLDYTS